MSSALPPIFCINLDRAPERLAHLQREALAAGIGFTRIAAVDALDPAAAARIAGLPARGPTGVMGVGTRACTLSHAKAWQALLDAPGAPPAAVILEDDVRLSADFAAVLAALAGRAPGVELVKLECHGPMWKGVLLARDAAMADGAALATRLTPRRWRRRSYQLAPGTAGYWLTRRGAELALARHAASNLPVDHFLFYPRAIPATLGLPYEVVAPAICVQDGSLASSIAAHRNEDPRWRRDLRRAPYEAAQAGGMLAALVTGKASFQRAPFER